MVQCRNDSTRSSPASPCVTWPRGTLASGSYGRFAPWVRSAQPSRSLFSIARAPGFRAFVLVAHRPVAAWVWRNLPSPRRPSGLAGYVPLHTLLEMVTGAIAVMISASPGRPTPTDRTAGRWCWAGFWCGATDIGHTLSYHGMPDFLTPNTVEKAINCWRRTPAAGVLLFVVAPWPARWDGGFCACPARAAGGVRGTGHRAELCVPLHGDRLPATYVAGSGLTPFKVRIRVDRALRPCWPGLACPFVDGPHPQLWNLALATDVYNLLGHVYKIAATAFVPRAVRLTTRSRIWRCNDHNPSCKPRSAPCPICCSRWTPGASIWPSMRGNARTTALPRSCCRTCRRSCHQTPRSSAFAAMDEARRTDVRAVIHATPPQGPGGFSSCSGPEATQRPADRREPTFLVLSRTSPKPCTTSSASSAKPG